MDNNRSVSFGLLEKRNLTGPPWPAPPVGPVRFYAELEIAAILKNAWWRMWSCCSHALQKRDQKL